MTTLCAPDSLFADKTHLFFDLDGTLADSAKGIITCHKMALESVGIAPPVDGEDLKRYVGPPMETIYGQLVPPDKVQTAIDNYNQYFVTEGRMLDVAPFKGIKSMLDSFRAAGRQMALVTSKYQTVAPRILEHMGFSPYFSHIYATGPISKTGDKTALIAYALDDLDLKAEQVVMIGDRHHDVIGARNNNVASIGVRWGYAPTGELEQAQVTKIAQTPKHLTALVLQPA